MKDRKNSRKPTASVDEFFRSVYDSLSVKVLAEQVASAPPTDEEIEAIEAAIEDLAAPAVTPPAQKSPSPAPKKRARS
jgi:hypothetical protein